MRQWSIENERIYDKGVEVSRLGLYKKDVEFPQFQRDQSFTFAFTPTSHSLGDWGVLSSLPKYIKKLYPNSTIVVPNPTLCYKIFQPLFDSGEWSSITKKPWETGQMMWQNNPYIDHWLSPGEWEYEIYTDHYRVWSYKDNFNEPLIEQILRAFGAKDEEITQWDTRPKLYFSKEEKEECDEIIKHHIGNNLYGCLLFSGRVEKYMGRWEFDSVLFDDAQEFLDMPIFYYAQFDLDETEWGNMFKNKINFKDLGLTLRQQLYIKQKSHFNLGYQSGMTDSISGGGSKIISLTPYDEQGLGSNCIRKVKYWFADNKFKIY